MSVFLPSNDEEFNFSKNFYGLASDAQIKHVPKKYWRGLVDTVDHSISIIAPSDKYALRGVDPKKIMLSTKSTKEISDWYDEKEAVGKFTWTLGLYGTPALAAEVGMSQKKYWDQIIKACYLDQEDPVAENKKILKEVARLARKLSKMKIERIHIEGEGVDLWVGLPPKTKWLGGSGRNIPSFEVFTSPDWRQTEGKIKFNQPLYRYGNLITGVALEFKKGKVIKATAESGQDILREMIAVKNADKVGEFSLTDKRLSRITEFMGETLYDENVGGKYGNTHVALGRAYKDAYDGDPSTVSAEEWKRLGYNDSAVHTDIMSTSDRVATAHWKDGRSQIIYKDGEFQI